MARYRRYIIAAAVLLVLVGVYAVAGFWAVPHFGRSAAQNFVKTHYGRTLSLREIRFNPFTLALDISDLSLPDADGKMLLGFGHLHVGLQIASLWRLGPSFQEILLDQPYVRAVIRRGGELNLADLGKGFPEEPKKPQPAESKPLRLYIGRFAISGGRGAFEDLTRAPPFEADFNSINFELRDFSTVGNPRDAYALSVVSGAGERFNWSGTLRLSPLASQGRFEFANLTGRNIWNYLRDKLPCELDSGLIGIKGEYEFASGGGPLALHVTVHNATVTDLGVRPRGGTQDYVKLDKISVDEARIDLAKHAVDVARVALSGGDVKVWVDEQGRVNLLDLAPSTAAPATPAAAAPPVHAKASGEESSPWTVSAPDIAVEGLKIAAEYRQVTPAIAVNIAPLNVHVAGFNTRPDDVLEVTVDSSINGTGKLHSKAKVTTHSGALSAHVDLESLELPVIQPLLSRYTSMTLLKGALRAHIDLEQHADGGFEVEGSTHVSDLKTVDARQKRDFVTWKDFKVEDVLYRSKPQSLRIKSVTALEPYARVIIFPDRNTNIKEILTPAGTKPPAATQAPDSAAPSPQPPSAPPKAKSKATAVKKNEPPAPPAAPLTPFPVSIGAVRFVNATLNYTDLWIKPSFSVGIQTLNGAVTGLSSDPKSRAKVELNGKVERYSPAHIGGEANVLSAALYTDITMSLKDIDLTIVNPYSGRFIGYKIDKGKLSVDVTYKIDDRKLDAKQHFVVDQLELGDRVESPDAVHGPVKLAVALLKDRHGVIDIDLPMNGSIDDPQFRIGPLIWKAFVNLIVKVATSPFALLGSLFGGGEHMNVVEFAAGSAELDKPAQEQLAAIAKSLKERPQLKLDVPIVYAKNLDAPKMAAARLNAELMARVAGTRQGKKHPESAGEEALVDPEKHYRLLVEQFHATLGKDAPLPASAQAVENAKRKETPPYEQAINDLEAALIAKIDVPEGDLVALGKDRTRAIQDALLSDGQIEPGRVFAVASTPKDETGDKVKVEMALK
jgi:hypothetical protein